jgi:hypothetical protein
MGRFRTPQALYGGEDYIIVSGATATEERGRKKEKEGSDAFYAHQSRQIIQRDCCAT